MGEIEFSEEAKDKYDAIHKKGNVTRKRLICRIYDKRYPKEGYLAVGSCFADILVITNGHPELTHVEYNPFEYLTDHGQLLVTGFGFNSMSRELLEPQKIHKPTLTKKEMEMWLHLGKTHGLIPKGRGTDNLLKKGIKISLDDSPTAILGALIHMRHMWREKCFIKSVLFLMSKTNMDFWQAYVLASNDRLENNQEHTTYMPVHRSGDPWNGATRVNILLLPALRMAHGGFKEVDERSVKTGGIYSWNTDQVFVEVAKFKVWVDFEALYDVDFRPLIYNDFLMDKGIKATKVRNFVKKVLGKKYKIDN